MKLQAEQPHGWHTVAEFDSGQEARIQKHSAYLADIAQVTMRILDDFGVPKCIYEPGFYAANPETASTSWRAL